MTTWQPTSKKSARDSPSYCSGFVMELHMRPRSVSHVSLSRAIGVLVRSRNTNRSTVLRLFGAGVNSFKLTCSAEQHPRHSSRNSAAVHDLQTAYANGSRMDWPEVQGQSITQEAWEAPPGRWS